MRIRKTTQGLTVRAIAGSHVVLLGFDMKRASCNHLLGFGIHRTDHTENESYWLAGLKTFKSTDPGFEPGTARYPTNKHPIQGFTWSDFSAKPGHRYTYRVVALKGTPDVPTIVARVDVVVTTEAEDAGNHDVYFNRGAAASQEYARRFGSQRPDENNPDDKRWAWLSRGAAEAIEAFIARATGTGWSIRVAAYEFRLDQLGGWLKDAKDRGVDVKVLYDGNNNQPDEDGVVFPRDANRVCARSARIKGLCKERVTRADVVKPPIAHHKFIVLLKNDTPQAVLTGSTNFSLGGVFGQSNVVHIVEEEDIARSYFDAWVTIAANPDHGTLRDAFSNWNQLPTDKPPLGTFVIMSPQRTLEALDWYAKLALEAPGALFMTFAFGINKKFLPAFEDGAAPLRYALLDKLLPPGTKKALRPAAEKAMRELRFKQENRFAVGNRLITNTFDRWVRESLTGLNSHVQYIHTKFMLIDPLGDDPIVITGSANFSDASTTENDENMLVIRRNLRVADIYLGEYMRLWNHYAFREWAAAHAGETEPRFKYLDETNSWWKEYFGNTARSRQRRYFSGVR
jgi:phosphatidylserine/phosphatidylglycerophosphate/cardiolipin synthase-like enzyme